MARDDSRSRARRSSDRDRGRGRDGAGRSPSRGARDGPRNRSCSRRRSSDSPSRRRGRGQDRRRSPSCSRSRRSRSRRRSPPRGTPPPAAPRPAAPAPGGAAGVPPGAPPAAPGGVGSAPYISPVLALGNFGGRAAGIGVPGQDDAITAYCRASSIDRRAEIALRGLPVHLAAEVMQQGPILGANSSAILMVRVHRAEQMAKMRPNVNHADLLTAQLSGDPVQLFIVKNGIDMAAARSLRALSPNQQHDVMNDGSLCGMNPSALLMSRIRRVQGLARL